MSIKVNIYRAADAFLYLPTYIADKEEIYETLCKGRVEFDFSVPGIENKSNGDIKALETMYKKSENSNDIHIALCDPLALFNPIADFVTEARPRPEKCRVFGALITKPPFWAVNSIEDVFRTDVTLAESFRTGKVIFYEEDFSTGHFLGSHLAEMAHAKRIRVGFFDAINRLKEEYENNPSQKILAVTADISSMAKVIPDGGQFNINHYYSQNENYQDFLTTGFVTTAVTCERYPDILAKVIEATQRAISTLHSSPKIALGVCADLQAQEKLSDEQIKWIIEQIHKENFYPFDMSIKKKQWEGAINSRKTWSNETRTKCKEFYNTIVIQDITESATGQFMETLGIGYSRQVKELEKLEKESVELNEDLNREKKEKDELRLDLSKRINENEKLEKENDKLNNALNQESIISKVLGDKSPKVLRLLLLFSILLSFAITMFDLETSTRIFFLELKVYLFLAVGMYVGGSIFFRVPLFKTLIKKFKGKISQIFLVIILLAITGVVAWLAFTLEKSKQPTGVLYFLASLFIGPLLVESIKRLIQKED